MWTKGESSRQQLLDPSDDFWRRWLLTNGRCTALVNSLCMRGVQYEKDALRLELLAEVTFVLVDHGGGSERCRDRALLQLCSGFAPIGTLWARRDDHRTICNEGGRMLAGRMLKSGRLAFVVGATAIAALLLMVGLVKATECNRFNALANSIMAEKIARDAHPYRRKLATARKQTFDCWSSASRSIVAVTGRPSFKVSLAELSYVRKTNFGSGFGRQLCLNFCMDHRGLPHTATRQGHGYWT